MGHNDNAVTGVPDDGEDIEAEEDAFFQAFGFVLEGDEDDEDEDEFFDLHGNDKNGEVGADWNIDDLLVIVPTNPQIDT
jgi:hypothetical protein